MIKNDSLKPPARVIDRRARGQLNSKTEKSLSSGQGNLVNKDVNTVQLQLSYQENAQ